MRKLAWAVGLGAVLAVGSMGSVVDAQQSQTPSATAPVVKAAADEVLLDVVVRDKSGHAVDDLKPEDFQVSDNGEPKTIKSFRLVEGREAIGAGGARTTLDPLQQIRLVTIILECRSTEARRLAQDAAMDLLKADLPPNVYLAVMAIDHKLEVLQPFTNDRDLLRAAIDRATRSGVVDFSADTERVRKELEKASPNAPSGGSADREALAKAAADQMLLQMLDTEHNNAMTDPGRAEIFALQDAVKEQYRLPGRKTVLYLSEGFTIPLGLEAAFKDVISTANRSNVSLYTVDAHGLGTVSTNQAGISQLTSAAQSAQDEFNNPGNQAVRPDEASLMDNTLRATRANYQTTLANLADSTGGFLVANTNDLQGPMRRLARDVQDYYEITYAPGIRNYDGSFHKVAIKISSGNLRVQSRSGYNALPPSLSSAGAALASYEIPLLAALDAAELPQAFSFESAALHFRGLRNQSVCELVVDVPLAGVTFEKNGDADQLKGRLSFVALLKDEHGAVIKKFRNEIPITGAATRLEALKANHFIYTEYFDLTPGSYTLESAVMDGEGNRISARKSSLVMPAPSGALAISSVAAIRNTKDRQKSTADDDPLLIGSKLVTPTLNPVVSKATTESLPFYLVIYSDKGVSTPPQLVMQFSRNGKVLGNGLPPLGPPDADGRIQYVALTPLSGLEPGDFSIRFIAKQGSEAAEETVSFVLQ